MDKRTVYSKCIKMLRDYIGDEINLEELTILIAVNCGSSKTTIDTAMKTMAMTNLIKDIGNFRFKIIKNG